MLNSFDRGFGMHSNFGSHFPSETSVVFKLAPGVPAGNDEGLKSSLIGSTLKLNKRYLKTTTKIFIHLHLAPSKDIKSFRFVTCFNLLLKTLSFTSKPLKLLVFLKDFLKMKQKFYTLSTEN
jgi:hypothetical protein